MIDSTGTNNIKMLIEGLEEYANAMKSPLLTCYIADRSALTRNNIVKTELDSSKLTEADGSVDAAKNKTEEKMWVRKNKREERRWALLEDEMLILWKVIFYQCDDLVTVRIKAEERYNVANQEKNLITLLSIMEDVVNNG